ncbi:hypothetical protein [Streptomyces sp. NPDC047014]|uniref:hypothetical protein n=1 Tax=Streptomyces sp. NPDC047014 TaxID=3155736 RepID=UPI0033D194FA
MKRSSLPVRLVLATVLTAICSATAAVTAVVHPPSHAADATRTVAAAEPKPCLPHEKCVDDTSWGG